MSPFEDFMASRVHGFHPAWLRVAIYELHVNGTLAEVRPVMIAADQAWSLENDHVKGTEIFRQIAGMYPKDARARPWL
jgi:hypothetical protein